MLVLSLKVPEEDGTSDAVSLEDNIHILKEQVFGINIHNTYR
jgi:hypothetical protein